MLPFIAFSLVKWNASDAAHLAIRNKGQRSYAVFIFARKKDVLGKWNNYYDFDCTMKSPSPFGSSGSDRLVSESIGVTTQIEWPVKFKFGIEMDSTPPQFVGEANCDSTSALTFGSIRIAHYPQFLPDKDRDALFCAVRASQKLFSPPGGVDSVVGSTQYWSDELGTDKTCSDQIHTEANALSKAVKILRTNIFARLPSIFRVLEVEPFPVTQISINLIHGLDGHSGIPHADSIDGRYAISLLYYFHQVPKKFRGGNLELYETDDVSSSGHCKEPLTNIENDDNLLLAFKSTTYHGVSDVHCDSREFSDGRFVAVSFLSNP